MKTYIYRSIVLILAAIALTKIIYIQAFLIDKAFIDTAKQFYDNEVVFNLYNLYGPMRIITLILYSLLGIAFFLLASHLFEKGNYWYALISIPVLSIVCGSLISIYNQELITYYSLYSNGKPLDTTYYTQFIQSTFRNSILCFCFFSISTSLSLIEKLFLKSTKYSQRLRPFSFGHWFTGILFFFFVIQFQVYLRIGEISGYSFSANLVPAIWLSLFITVLAMLWLSFLSSTDKDKFKDLRYEIPKLCILTIGLFTITSFSGPGMFDLHWTIYFDLFYSSLPIYFLLILVVIIASYLVFALNIGNVKGRLNAQEKLETVSSELSLLKSQINPHFLFNSLNTVYGLALEEQSPKSAEGVQKLSDMMRFMLQENTAERIPLEREIKYINDYIDFQRLRIADRENIQLEINIDESCKGEIAPMLLIPMIENAFKHGISLEKPSWIKLALKCQNDEVHLNIQNSMHPKTGGKSEESGIGLENVRQRLKILYPDKHLFQLIECEELFEANIKVTLS